MIFVGWVLGLMIGGVLAVGLLPSLGLAPAVAGILTVLTAPVAPIIAPFIPMLSIPLAMLGGGLALLVVTIMAYALAAVSLLGAVPVALILPTNPVELMSRGVLLGLCTAANALLISVFTGMPLLMTVVLVMGLLTTIPPVAADRTVFQPLLGLLSWVLPMSWLVQPLGVMLFVLNLPFAIAQSGFAAIQFDIRTMAFETSGGALLNFIFSLSPTPVGGFCLGNFTFIRLAPGTALTLPPVFTAPGLSVHETGHTLTVAAFGGFFGWVNAIDENIPPPGRGTAAYGEIIPESHFGPSGAPALPMW